MAFNVAPTSGDGPYIVTASISNSVVIDGVNFYADVRTSISENNCPLNGSADPWSAFNVDNLVNGGSVTTSYPNVPAGSCRAISLRIMRVSDDSVVDIATVFIDNV